MTAAETFEAHRPALLAVAWRMVGSLSEAEDLVSDLWLTWDSEHASVAQPRAWLTRALTRRCLDHLRSARVRREEAAGVALPEPVAAAPEPLAWADGMSLAFLVLLQELTAAERAVFLLHEVFGLAHAEIGEALGRSEAACRQLLRRGRARVDEGRQRFDAPADEHARLLRLFARTCREGDVEGLAEVLADDARLVADGGRDGATFGRLRNLRRPLQGPLPVARFATAAMAQAPETLTYGEEAVNGQPALVVRRPDGSVHSVVQIAASGGRIHRVYVLAAAERLARL